jgi:hypothetical protein
MLLTRPTVTLKILAVSLMVYGPEEIPIPKRYSMIFLSR